MDAATLTRLAEQNLAQIQAWTASSDRDRRMKAHNEAQCRRYLEAMRATSVG